jgi:hypothetical protein
VGISDNHCTVQYSQIAEIFVVTLSLQQAIGIAIIGLLLVIVVFIIVVVGGGDGGGGGGGVVVVVVPSLLGEMGKWE